MAAFFLNLNKDYSTRYEAGKFFDFNVDNVDPLTSVFFNEINNIPPAGYWYVVIDEGRPDIISNTIYDDTQYWWLLLMFNGIVYPWWITTGDILSYPSEDDLDALYFSLTSLSVSSGVTL